MLVLLLTMNAEKRRQARRREGTGRQLGDDCVETRKPTHTTYEFFVFYHDEKKDPASIGLARA